MTIAVHALLVAVAALAGLWFVQGLGPVRDQKAGLAAVTAKDGRTPQERAARGYRLLEEAAAHTRSTGPDLNLSPLDVVNGLRDLGGYDKFMNSELLDGTQKERLLRTAAWATEGSAGASADR